MSVRPRKDDQPLFQGPRRLSGAVTHPRVETQTDLSVAEKKKRSSTSKTSPQIKIMWAGIVVLILLLLFPPWKFSLSLESYKNEQPGPYAFVFTPPDVPNSEIGRSESFQGVARQYWSPHIDVIRLMLPIGIILVIATGLFFTLRGGKNPTEVFPRQEIPPEIKPLEVAASKDEATANKEYEDLEKAALDYLSNNITREDLARYIRDHGPFKG